MSSPPNPPKDPRFRPFRVAMYALYLTAVGTISLLIIVSVVRSVSEMSPSHKGDREPTLTVKECLDRADAMWRDLDAHRKALTDQRSARRADDEWSKFRVQWLQQKRDVEAQCALGSRGRASIEHVYSRLERVMDLYTIHATQYAGEIGTTVDDLRESMEAARKDPAAGRLR